MQTLNQVSIDVFSVSFISKMSHSGKDGPIFSSAKCHLVVFRARSESVRLLQREPNTQKSSKRLSVYIMMSEARL